MNKYVDVLGLDFDPFEAGATDASVYHGGNNQHLLEPSFYQGGNRQFLLEQLVGLSQFSSAISLVTAPLGSGKTTIAISLIENLQDEAETVMITASLFMDRTRLLEIICDQLNLKPADSGVGEESIAAIKDAAQQLADNSSFLQLVVDEAHELGRDLLETITQFALDSSSGNIRLLLLGENQLANMVDSIMPAAASEDAVVRYTIDTLGFDDAIEYLEFKLQDAGYVGHIPLGHPVLTDIYEKSGGNPGTLNMLVSTELNNLNDTSTRAEARAAATGFSLPVSKTYIAVTSVLAMILLIFMVSGGGGEDDEVILAENDPQEFAVERIQVPLSSPAISTPSQNSGSGIANVARSSQPLSPPLIVPPPSRTLRSIDSDEFDIIVNPEDERQSESQLQADIPAPEISRADVLPPTVPGVEPESTVNIPGEPKQEPQAELVAPTAVVNNPPASVRTPAPVSTAAPVSTRAPVSAPVSESRTAVAVASGSDRSRLLSYNAQSYTLQLLGSHSEDSVKNFIQQSRSNDNYAYFETRYQDKPWFVVVYGNFTNRAAATAAINALPEAQKKLEPWARTLAGIQQDIRRYGQ